MTKKDLQTWVKLAVSKSICDYTVPWVAAGSKYGFELAMEWIDSKEEHIAAAGWSTLSGLVSVKSDDELNIPALKKLLKRVEKNIHSSENRVRSTMNSFTIAAGTFVKELTKDAIAVAVNVGTVKVDMNGTACKVPDAMEYIKKVSDKGLLGRKKKVLKC
jgi:hypothetical protein